MPCYSVGFTIHEAVFSAINPKKPIDPLVVVRCFENEFSTSVKPSKTIIACWDESHQWNNIELSQKSWNSGIIEFELQSANALWRNDTLGIAALQLKLISTLKDNAFSGEIPLMAPNSVRIVGYLTITVNAYDLSQEARNNSQPSVTKELTVDQPTSLEVPPLTSPLVYRSAVPTEVSKVYKYFHLYINVYSLEDVETEMFGFYPHITCEYSGCRLQSSKPIRVKGNANVSDSNEPKMASGVEDKTSLDLISEKISSYIGSKTKLLAYNTEVNRSNYTFNQCFLMPVRVAVGEPTLEDNIILRVWKGYSVELPNLFGKNGANRPGVSSKLLAEGIFSLAKLRSGRQRARWFNFYNGSEETAVTNITRSEDDTVEKSDKSFSMSGINERYSGRILIGASVKRINKVSDVLKAHVVASHQLEPLTPSPTRIFCDVFSIESSNNFSFSGPFQVCLEVSCGPYKMATDWQAVSYRRDTSSEMSKHLDFLGENMRSFVDEEGLGGYSGKDLGSKSSGWVCNFDSVKGRLQPMELLVSYNAEEQWFIFVRVLARKDGDRHVSVLGSSKFSFEDLPDYQPNSAKVPLWISLTTQQNSAEPVGGILANTTNWMDEFDKSARGLSRTSSISTADTERYQGNEGNMGKMTANVAFLNVLLTLEKDMFYSSTFNTASNKQFRVVSHSRRTSMVLASYELRCYLYACKMDRIYENLNISVVCDGKRKSTSSRKNKSLFPVFMECLTMPISALTPVNNIVPNVPILVTINHTQKQDRYAYSNGLEGKGTSEVLKKRVKVDVSHVLYSAVVTYNRLITSAAAHDKTGGLPRWLKIGNCELLLFVDLVSLSEAKHVPKFQMLPDVQDLSIQLGLLGLRNLKYTARYFDKVVNNNMNLVIKACMQNYGVCTDDEQYYEISGTSDFSTTWQSDGKKNCDLFTVHELNFKSPIGLVFDPFLELKIMLGSDVLGYCCFPVYRRNIEVEKCEFMKDLRFALVPSRMFEVLDKMQKVGNKGSYELKESVNGSENLVDNGLAEILQNFHETKEFKKMVKSLEYDNTSVYVPPKFLIVNDGARVVNSSVLSYNLISDENIEGILNDIPYSTQYLYTNSGTVDKGLAGQRLWSKAVRKTDRVLSTSDENEMGSIKYFLTVSDSKGYQFSSYDLKFKDVAVQAGKMVQMFRNSLKSTLFKLRLSLLSSSSFPDDKEGSSTFLAVEIAGRQNREMISGSEGLVCNINKSYEREIFLPEHSLITFKVIQSYSNLGDEVEQVMGTGYIDLENRWFSKTWQKMQRNDNVPIERILIYEKGHVKGHVNLLLQLEKIDKFPLLKTINLNTTPTSSVEIRLVIWSVREAKIPYSESKKDMLDLFVCSRLDCHTYSGSYASEQKTDVHYNCNSGSASFNWRIVYPEVKTPLGACHLQLSVYDFWKIGSPIFVGDVNLELKSYINTVSTTGNKVKVNGELPIYPNAKSTPTGLLQVTLQVLTQSEANTNNVRCTMDDFVGGFGSR